MALVVAGTDFIQMPAGTTAQRPVAPAQGMQRYNTTLAYTEVYTGAAWVQANPPTPSAAGQIPFSTDGSTYTSTAKIVSGTAVASTSGTSIDFTSIPSWVKRITVMLSGVSTSGTSIVQIQLGTGAGPTYTTSGYLGSASTLAAAATSSNSTTGFFASSFNSASNIRHGTIVISNLTGNTWTAFGVISLSEAAATSTTAGSIALGATLTAVRITTVNGTDTFDAGSINILYE
jgi:hypothetical protein